MLQKTNWKHCISFVIGLFRKWHFSVHPALTIAAQPFYADIQLMVQFSSADSFWNFLWDTRPNNGNYWKTFLTSGVYRPENSLICTKGAGYVHFLSRFWQLISTGCMWCFITSSSFPASTSEPERQTLLTLRHFRLHSFAGERLVLCCSFAKESLVANYSHQAAMRWL